MFRIRRLTGDTPSELEAIEQAKSVLRGQFAAMPDDELAGLSARLRGTYPGRFRTLLFVGEGTRRGQTVVEGCALVLHDPVGKFCWLDYLASKKGLSGRGVGGAIYGDLRGFVKGLDCLGLFYECARDTLRPGQELEPELLAQNRARIDFYERLGARVLADNDWDLPPPGFPTSQVLTLLVWDGVDRGAPLARADAQTVARTILEAKYRDMCPPFYVDSVVASFRADPVPVRERRERKKAPAPVVAPRPPLDPVLVVHDERHKIHHIRERGYFEAPTRVESILAELKGDPGFELVGPAEVDTEAALREVHDPALIEFLRKACETAPTKECIYPYVFPVRNRAREPRDLHFGAGYYCIDTFTPITREAFPAAVVGASCALTAADALLAGRRLAYALVRPPGHHAERRNYGGFCYFNNAAVAAQRLLRLGPRVAIVDIDYHHGNGQQEIFYERADVLTVSLHGDPTFSYPFFTGFADEVGEGAGAGLNLNIPLPEEVDGPAYLRAFEPALARLREFAPAALVVALGLDTAKKDPTGSWSLGQRDFTAVGARLRSLGLPTLVVQEGGYRSRTLATNARAFFDGLRGAVVEPAAPARRRARVCPRYRAGVASACFRCRGSGKVHVGPVPHEARCMTCSACHACRGRRGRTAEGGECPSCQGVGSYHDSEAEHVLICRGCEPCPPCGGTGVLS